jgi:hypothetical protein
MTIVLMQSWHFCTTPKPVIGVVLFNIKCIAELNGVGMS